jgi:hypothetical protein
MPRRSSGGQARTIDDAGEGHPRVSRLFQTKQRPDGRSRNGRNLDGARQDSRWLRHRLTGLASAAPGGCGAPNHRHRDRSVSRSRLRSCVIAKMAFFVGLAAFVCCGHPKHRGVHGVHCRGCPPPCAKRRRQGSVTSRRLHEKGTWPRLTGAFSWSRGSHDPSGSDES